MPEVGGVFACIVFYIIFPDCGFLPFDMWNVGHLEMWYYRDNQTVEKKQTKKKKNFSKNSNPTCFHTLLCGWSIPWNVSLSEIFLSVLTLEDRRRQRTGVPPPLLSDQSVWVGLSHVSTYLLQHLLPLTFRPTPTHSFPPADAPCEGPQQKAQSQL